MSSQKKQFDLDRIRAISIVEVAKRLDTVRKTGINHVTFCPWHEDHHPSLSLCERNGKNYCHCFSCDKGGDVIAYVMQHEQWTFQEACQWLSNEFGISTVPTVIYSPRPKPKPVVKQVEPTYTYIPTELLDKMVSPENSLCCCLMQFFRPEAVEWITEEYRIGCYSRFNHDDYTVFPSIDTQGRICNLKAQHYCTDPASPRFAHSDEGSCFWIGKILSDNGTLPKDAVFQSSCMFGEHLLSKYPDSKVALVESPKNAIFGALSFPTLTWVATGNKGMLKREVLKPLQHRDVVVIPDRDAIKEWSDAISKMGDLANFIVSDFCEQIAPHDEPKYDIADFLLQQLLEIQKS